MRWLPKSIPCLVVCIALYFTVHFGIEAIRVLTSPVYGLDQSSFANVVHGIWKRLPLDADGLRWIALFIGATKLAIAGLFAVYLVSRLKSLFGEETDHEIVDAAALLVVTVTIVAAMPAAFEGATDAIAQYRLPLWLAGLVATLSMIERVTSDEKQSEHTAAWARRMTFYDVALPPKRNDVSTLRWDALRRSVNINAHTGN